MSKIDFVGFAADCRIRGRTRLFGDRMTDMLNGQERFRLSGVTLESLEDGHVVEVEHLVVARSDLLAVMATGPRGSARQRLTLDAVRMQVGLGPYVVAGRVHTEHGADPVSTVLQRPLMVPLTDATVAFPQAGEVRVVDAGTLIVNRDLVEWIAPAEDEASHFPDVEVRRPAMDYAKDLAALAAF